MTPPTTANSMRSLSNSSRIVFGSTCISAEPSTMPSTLPSPPRSATPPSTAPAIAYSS
jgi:hypothetical protein